MERAPDLIMLILLLTCQQTSVTSEKVARSVSAWYSQYHDLTAINKKLNELNSTFDNAFLFSIGKSSEGRDMMALNITGAKIKNKPLFYTQCLIHAREWVSGSMCLYMADELTKNYGVDPKITALLDKMDFVILPVANPDGYAYSWYNGGKNDYTRLWVKNRRRLSKRCHGVNLNRNFDYAFGHKIDEESRKDPCSKTYIGRYAFSEPETRNIRDYLMSLGGNLRGFIDFRAKGRSWHYPWKYTYEGSADAQEQKRVAIEAVRAIYYNGGYSSSYMSHSAGLGIQAGGTCMDWVYGHLGVKYSFTVKLQNRYGGSDGYKLRPAFIPATVKEAFIGVKALVNAMNV